MLYSYLYYLYTYDQEIDCDSIIYKTTFMVLAFSAFLIVTVK